jgi:hypothetical protein
MSHKNLPHFPCQNRIVVLPLLYLVFHAHSQLYELFCTAQKQPQKILKSASKIMPEMPRFSCQIHTVVQTIQNRTGCTDLYSTTSHSRKIFRPKNSQKLFLGNRALLPWKMCLLSHSLFSLKHTQKISLTHLLLSSRCLAHYPMHSFINLKMTFSLQSVFSPFPTLYPKAKIRSCLFQDKCFMKIKSL